MVFVCNLIKELECPICLDIFESAVISTKCYHRFCEACINGIQECPYCKANISSTIIEDRNSRNLIDILKNLALESGDEEVNTNGSRDERPNESQIEVLIDLLSQSATNSVHERELQELYDTLQVTNYTDIPYFFCKLAAKI